MTGNQHKSLRDGPRSSSSSASKPYGDLKLLATSVVLILLCIVAIVIQLNMRSHETSANAKEAEVAVQVTEASSPVPEATEDKSLVSDSRDAAIEELERWDRLEGDLVVAAPVMSEEVQEKLKEMARQRPPGEAIVF